VGSTNGRNCRLEPGSEKRPANGWNHRTEKSGGKIDSGLSFSTASLGGMSQLEVPMDSDLNDLSREQLIAELVKLRNAVRVHRDSTGHDLCWPHPALWDLLPEKSSVRPVVPEWPVFLHGCLKYRQSLDEQLPDAPRSSEEFSGHDGA
jgi:hypothetical protein